MARRESMLWLEMARRDLADAEDMLVEEKWYRAAFFAHQAAEKALKALYPELLKREPPRSHTIGDLLRELKSAGIDFGEREREAQMASLSKYYTVTRYPDAANGPPWESVDPKEAERAVRVAKEVMMLAQRILEEEGA